MSDDLSAGIREKGWAILLTQINGSGRQVHLIDFGGGSPTVAMFRDDLDALLRGRMSVEQIMTKNKGADLADPWPVG